MRKGQLWCDLEIVGRLVAAALPPSDALCRLFEPISGGAGDIVEPTMDQLLLAHDAFYSLPDAEQRRILNGWSPYPDREGKTPDETVDYFRALYVGMNRDGVFAAGHDLYPGVGTNAVHVFIREGATKAETLRTLRGITALLSERWEAMIDHERMRSSIGPELCWDEDAQANEPANPPVCATSGRRGAAFVGSGSE